MISDLKYAFRQLVKRPGFAVFVVLTLALGIGANTAIFTVINSVLLSSLPVKDPQQLVFLSDPDNHGMFRGGETGKRAVFTYPEFLELNERTNAFSGILAVSGQAFVQTASLEDAGQSLTRAWARVSLVSGNYFSVLGSNAILGRTFDAAVDKVRDANPVTVISYQYWQEALGGEPSVIGKRIRIQNTIYDIIGVAPRGFTGETVGWTIDAWVPLSMQAEVLPGFDGLTPETDPTYKTAWLQLIGRMRPGIGIEQAKASINVTFHQYLQAQVGAVSQTGRKTFLDQMIEPVDGSHGASTLRKGFGEPLVIIMVLVGLLLLTACVNVANLLLARAASRQKEIAVRVAVGARPGRIFRQLLTESIVLSLLGGAGGVLLAKWGDYVLLQMLSLTGKLDVGLNPGVLGFTLGVSIFVGILFGTAPALQAARLDLNAVMKGTAGSGRASVDRAFVVAQVAFSLLLLIAAGLFVHSFQKLATADLGYDRDHLLFLNLGDPVGSGYKAPTVGPLYRQLSERMRALPGVRAVSYSTNSLLSSNDTTLAFSIEGLELTTAQKDYIKNTGANFEQVGPGYFSAVGIPILVGRDFRRQDAGGQRVGVINRAMARFYFGDRNPLGRLITITGSKSFLSAVGNPSFVVVGVANDAKYHQIREDPRQRAYVPFENPLWPANEVTFDVRASGDPDALVSALRTAVKDVAPSLSSVYIQTMNQRAQGQLGSDLLLTKLSGFFGVLAILFASIGIYGILSYTVARRLREIGIRIALGAQRGNILWLVVSDSLILVLAGVAIGVPATLIAGRLIAGLLFGLTPADPPVVAAAVAMMFVVATIAGYFPARRATKVDPMIALRAE